MIILQQNHTSPFKRGPASLEWHVRTLLSHSYKREVVVRQGGGAGESTITSLSLSVCILTRHILHTNPYEDVFAFSFFFSSFFFSASAFASTSSYFLISTSSSAAGKMRICVLPFTLVRVAISTGNRAKKVQNKYPVLVHFTSYSVKNVPDRLCRLQYCKSTEI